MLLAGHGSQTPPRPALLEDAYYEYVSYLVILWELADDEPANEGEVSVL